MEREQVRIYRLPEILDHAAEVIEEQGWCQGTLRNRAGRVCAQGAIGVAGCRVFDFSSLRNEAVRHAIIALDNHVGTAASRWNDQPGRTEADVIEALRRCAKELV